MVVSKLSKVFMIGSSEPSVSGGNFLTTLTLALDELRRTNTHRAFFSSSDGQASIQFFAQGAATPNSHIPLTQEAMDEFVRSFPERVYLWPDPTDSLFATNVRKKRLFVSPAGGESILIDANPDPVLKPTNGWVLENPVFHNVTPLIERLCFTGNDRQTLEKLTQLRSGLILCSAGQKQHQVDAPGILLALRPDAIFAKGISTRESAMELLTQAEHRLVVVAIPGGDIMTILTDFHALLEGSTTLMQRFTTVIAGVYAQRRVRRTCGNCARSTPITTSQKERIPPIFKQTLPESYPFGRGCERCGQLSYRGTVELNSVLLVTPQIRDLIRIRAPQSELYLQIFRTGTRTLFEDCLEKILQGFTTFEEFASHVPVPSAGAIEALTALKQQQSVVPQKSAPGPIESTTDLLLNTTDRKIEVLLVEDDADQSSVLELVFRQAGYDVRIATNGKVALDLLQQKSCDIVVCDLMMPVMSGEQLTRTLRQQSATKAIPILILTATDSPDKECDLLASGADDYCSKNVKRKVLLKRVERLLERSKSGANPVNHLLAE